MAIARAAYEHGQEGLELCAVIEAAFADAKLGDGVGLSQGNGMDDYKDEAACAALRADDEKEDWRNLTTEALNRYNWSLSYFDAEGMRFHLPAFLICDLKGGYNFGMASHLSYGAGRTERQFSLLSREQRIAVRLFLFHILQDPDYAFDRPEILQALDESWVQPE